ncbi:MAG: acyl-CoA thioesterase [Actinomycetota bacterium]|nr:acyl-CoA thioesterase [Actinomycetota bacterium]
MPTAEVSRRMLPSHANPAGTVFGGEMLAQCDEAAGIAASRHARARVATAKVDAMEFLEPVMIGDVLTCKAAVNAVFGSSMEVGVRVEAENTLTGDVRHASSAYFVMVALDEDGEPFDVDDLEPSDDDSKRRHREANERQQARKPN